MNIFPYLIILFLIIILIATLLLLIKERKAKPIIEQIPENIKKEAEELVKQTKRNEMKMKRDLEMARKIQSGLLSKNKIQNKKYLLSALCLPAEKIGGDFFIIQKDIKNNVTTYKTSPGVIKLSKHKDETINFAIGDVSGHGVASALVMILSKNTLEELFLQKLPPKQIMEIANKRLLEYTEGSAINFVTIFGASLDVSNNKLVYSKAGHTPPILLRKDNSVMLLETEGVFLGMFDSPEFEQKEILLEKGDKILLYTDGLTEAKDENNELFGSQRLTKILLDNHSLSSENLFQKILDEVKEYNNNQKIDDDLTMLLLEYD
jgi:phosphoserine phosphatase RsbU/P